MTVQDLIDNGYEDVVVFGSGDKKDYDGCIIGVSHDNRAVYSRKLMVQWLMEQDKISEEEANEWIDYNTIRSLPYREDSPIVLEFEDA